MTTGFVFEPGNEHDFKGHPEHAGRLAAVWDRMESSGVLAELAQIEAVEATDEQLLTTHNAVQLDLVKWAAGQGGGFIGADTYTRPGTHIAASRAAGGCCALVDALLLNKIDNGVALVRPPGHHAGVSSIEGFCLYNNIAVAARQAQLVHGYNKIAIVDFDVHHGNGTQNIFESEDAVLFCSVHMAGAGFYPGSGFEEEIGRLDGNGFTVNVPFPAGIGDDGYLAVFDELIRPKLTQFNPELILVSAGFDGHWRDPLAEALLSLTGYAKLCQMLIEWADELCDGKVLFVLEGGYDLEVLSFSVLNLLYALLRKNIIEDPLGATSVSESDVTNLLVKLKQRHLLE